LTRSKSASGFTGEPVELKVAFLFRSYPPSLSRIPGANG
jgi:hypothetical protein